MSSINAITPGIHHIGLRIMNMDRTLKFYRDVLGFKVLIEGPELSIFAAGKTFIAFKVADPRDDKHNAFSPFEVGLDHMALAIETEQELRRLETALSKANVENTGVKMDETLGKLYIAFKDPDRISWEYYMA